jgi:rhodanese-related sulfurtransferase
MSGLNWKQTGVLFAITLALILAFSPFKKSEIKKIDAATIAKAIENRQDHITAEQLGKLIIDKDPYYQLIDLRESGEYKTFHIPTAVNYPLDHLFEDSVLGMLDRDKLIVLYTNGGTHAAQAWVLLHQLGFTNSTVLLGGLNYWVDVYSNPDSPEDMQADAEIFRYQFLKSAGKTLLGGSAVKEQTTTESLPPPAIPVRRKVKKRGDEGC